MAIIENGTVAGASVTNGAKEGSLNGYRQVNWWKRMGNCRCLDSEPNAMQQLFIAERCVMVIEPVSLVDEFSCVEQ